MKPTKDELASWSSILGSAATVLGLIQSTPWLIVFGASVTAISVVAVVTAQRRKRILNSAAVSLKGYHLDSLNLANLRRRLNRSLFVQSAYHSARIDGRNLAISWRYDGYCQSARASSMEFSVDSDALIPFNELDCFAYDLEQDPACHHKIKPILVGNDGLSKKIEVPFSNALVSGQRFSVLLNCMLPGCLTPGIQYYTSTLSFEQKSVQRLAVHIIFIGEGPDWLRVYECNSKGQPELVSDLRPVKQDENSCEYIDVAENTPGQSVRIYIFHMNGGLKTWDQYQLVGSNLTPWEVSD